MTLHEVLEDIERKLVGYRVVAISEQAMDVIRRAKIDTRKFRYMLVHSYIENNTVYTMNTENAEELRDLVKHAIVQQMTAKLTNHGRPAEWPRTP